MPSAYAAVAVKKGGTQGAGKANAQLGIYI
jgi:hypothetical protein